VIETDDALVELDNVNTLGEEVICEFTHRNRFDPIEGVRSLHGDKEVGSLVAM
jgi:hypothetical protein